ncbi:MAG: DUF3990 domain-containing protein [Planctomycetes bacterium]|nr:DUF3990 domain-containing protein [Planctomycetota bacterium]
MAKISFPAPAIHNPAPSWHAPRSEYVVLWHGCTERDKDSIEHGISLAHCAVNTDFGRGFYTTTIERQAEHWALGRLEDWQRKYPGLPNRAVKLRFRMRRYAAQKRPAVHERGMDTLKSLAFVVGDFHYEDYWSVVQHCRQSLPNVVPDHRRPPGQVGGGWYDLVSGPVAAFWRQRVARDDSDQFSFHTPAGIRILNALIHEGVSGHPDHYSWGPV